MSKVSSHLFSQLLYTIVVVFWSLLLSVSNTNYLLILIDVTFMITAAIIHRALTLLMCIRVRT